MIERFGSSVRRKRYASLLRGIGSQTLGQCFGIEIPVIAVYIFANFIFCGRIGFFQRMDLFGIAVGIDKLGDGKISTGKEKNIHT